MRIASGPPGCGGRRELRRGAGWLKGPPSPCGLARATGHSLLPLVTGTRSWARSAHSLGATRSGAQLIFVRWRAAWLARRLQGPSFTVSAWGLLPSAVPLVVAPFSSPVCVPERVANLDARRGAPESAAAAAGFRCTRSPRAARRCFFTPVTAGFTARLQLHGPRGAALGARRVAGTSGGKVTHTTRRLLLRVATEGASPQLS